MPFVKANDLSIYYDTQGSGTPLILIGGYSQNSLAWQAMIPALSKHFQVTTFDNRGAGQTETTPGGYSIELLAEDVIGLMDKLDIENAHFIGQSMGALITQQLCLHHSDRVRKAILIAPFASLPPIARHNLQTQLQLLAQGIDRKLLVRLNSAWLLSNECIAEPKNVDEFVSSILSNPYPPTAEGLLGQAEALTTADLRRAIHKIPHELLLLVGEHDIDAPPYCAEYISEKIPICQTKIFKGQGHLMSYEIPEKLTKASLDFLLQG